MNFSWCLCVFVGNASSFVEYFIDGFYPFSSSFHLLPTKTLAHFSSTYRIASAGRGEIRILFTISRNSMFDLHTIPSAGVTCIVKYTLTNRIRNISHIQLT